MKKVKVLSASWCTGCKQLKANLDILGVPYEEVDVDVDTGMQLAKSLQVRSIPTTVVLEGEGVLKVFTGQKAGEIAEFVKG